MSAAERASGASSAQQANGLAVRVNEQTGANVPVLYASISVIQPTVEREKEERKEGKRKQRRRKKRKKKDKEKGKKTFTFDL